MDKGYIVNGVLLGHYSFGQTKYLRNLVKILFTRMISNRLYQIREQISFIRINELMFGLLQGGILGLVFSLLKKKNILFIIHNKAENILVTFFQIWNMVSFFYSASHWKPFWFK